MIPSKSASPPISLNPQTGITNINTGQRILGTSQSFLSKSASFKDIAMTNQIAAKKLTKEKPEERELKEEPKSDKNLVITHLISEPKVKEQEVFSKPIALTGKTLSDLKKPQEEFKKQNVFEEKKEAIEFSKPIIIQSIKEKLTHAELRAILEEIQKNKQSNSKCELVIFSNFPSHFIQLASSLYYGDCKNEAMAVLEQAEKKVAQSKTGEFAFSKSYYLQEIFYWKGCIFYDQEKYTEAVKVLFDAENMSFPATEPSTWEYDYIKLKLGLALLKKKDDEKAVFYLRMAIGHAKKYTCKHVEFKTQIEAPAHEALAEFFIKSWNNKKDIRNIHYLSAAIEHLEGYEQSEVLNVEERENVKKKIEDWKMEWEEFQPKDWKELQLKSVFNKIFKN